MFQNISESESEKCDSAHPCLEHNMQNFCFMTLTCQTKF